MKIAFVILTYNSDKFIEDCLSSILKFKSIEYSIYVIDNGSKDQTIEIIKSFSDVNIHLICLEKNYGTTISRNKGLKKITDEQFVCILDSDTIVNEEAIISMINYLQNHKDVGLVGPSMKNINGELQTPYRKFPNLKLKLYKALPIKRFNDKGHELESYILDDKQTEVICDYLISACWVMPVSTLSIVGLLDERIFYAPEDVEYCIRVWKNNLKIVHLKKPCIIHYYQRISRKKLISKVNLSHFYCLIRMLTENRNFLKERRKIKI